MTNVNLRLKEAENALHRACPDPAEDLDIVVRTEQIVRGPDDVPVVIPDTTPFPEGFEVTYESTHPDGSRWRVWKQKPSN